MRGGFKVIAIKTVNLKIKYIKGPYKNNSLLVSRVYVYNRVFPLT